MESPRYLSGLTPLRGFAAIWVVLFHFDDIVGHLVPRSATPLLTKGYQMVDFFFVLSGFVMCHVYGDRLRDHGPVQSAGGYLKARFFRLYPLHLFALGTHLALFAATTLLAPHVIKLAKLKKLYAVSKLPSQLLLGQSVGLGGVYTWNMPSWSISAEWWTYLLALAIIPFVHVGQGNPKRARTILVAVACLTGLTLAQIYLGKGALNLVGHHSFLRCVLEFSFGACVYQWYGRRPMGALSTDLAFVGLLLGMLALMHFGRGSDVALIPVFGMLIVATASNHGRVQALLETRALRWFGDVSYSVYMLHYLGIIVIWLVQLHLSGTRTGTPFEPAMLASVFAGYLTTLLLSASLTHRFIELPVLRWAKRQA